MKMRIRLDGGCVLVPMLGAVVLMCRMWVFFGAKIPATLLFIYR